MTEDHKSPNKTQPTASKPQTQQPSKPGSKDLGVWGSKYLASETERKQFADAHPGEIIFGLGVGHKPKN